MNPSMEFARKISLAYNAECKALCRELHLPQTAFDILMFLANNPEYNTARDIVNVRKIKANLVSVNISRLVEEGYLAKEAIASDHRKTLLVCTKKAVPIIEKGRLLQDAFFQKLFLHTTKKERETFFHIMRTMEQNLDELLKENQSGAGQKE